MSAGDRISEAAQQMGDRIKETTTMGKHDALHAGDRASETTHDTGRGISEMVSQCTERIRLPSSAHLHSLEFCSTVLFLFALYFQLVCVSVRVPGCSM